MTTTMTAQEIRETGKRIKFWTERDGSWYEYRHEIWQVGDKQYKVTDHVPTTLGGYGTCSKYGQVEEISSIEVPTHLGMIIAWKGGRAWIETTEQGTPESIAEWYNKMLEIFEQDCYKRRDNHELKIVRLGEL